MQWKGKPYFKSYLLSKCVPLLKTLLFIGCIYGLFRGIELWYQREYSWFFAHAISFVAFSSSFIATLIRIMRYRKIVYEVSENGIIISKGKRRSRIKIIRTDMIKFVETRKYLADWIFGTYTIKVYSGQISEVNDMMKQIFDDLENIKEYNEVRTILNLN